MLGFDGLDGGGETVFGGDVALDWVNGRGGDAEGCCFERVESTAEDEDVRGAVEGEGAGHHLP